MKGKLYTSVLLVGFFLLGMSSCFDKNKTVTTYSGRSQNKIESTSAKTDGQALTEADLEKMSKDEIINFLKGKSSDQALTVDNLVDMSKSLSFRVKNDTGRAVFVTCFYWMKNGTLSLWRWDKSKVYKVDASKTKLIVLDEIPEARDRSSTFGYLAVFDSLAEAEKAVIELMDERRLIDLDLLEKLKNKIITLFVQKYGVVGKRLGYRADSEKDLVRKKDGKDLDILVENQTGKDILVTCFIYEQPENTNNLSLWRYTKTSIKKIKNGQTVILDLPVVADFYRWTYMRGVLGVFDAADSEVAQQATFEQTKPVNKIELGLLTSLENKKIILSVEKYGVLGDFIDYVVKPAKFKLIKK